MTELLAFNWGTVGSVLLAILILLAMITVHEFGHYIVGKLLNFRINEFSVGFGPALFKHKNKKTGELFSVRLIPLGGYCAFDGEDGIAAEEGNATAPSTGRTASRRRREMPKRPKRRSRSFVRRKRLLPKRR